MKVIVMEEMSKLKMSKEEPLDLTFKPIYIKAYSCDHSEMLQEDGRRMPGEWTGFEGHCKQIWKLRHLRLNFYLTDGDNRIMME